MMLGLAVAIALLILTAWLTRYKGVAPMPAGEPGLRMVDTVAFRNLVSKEDDIFLKNSLPARYYWIAKKARTRAIQQYLLWVASGCLSVQRLVRSDAPKSAETQVRARSLSAIALRLRLLSLGLWSSLWLQRVFPQLDLMPSSVITGYNKLARTLSGYLAARSGRSEATARSLP